MPVSIGIRCTPQEVVYAIIESAEDKNLIKIVDSLIVPKALRLPEQLKFIRHTFLDVVNENQITNACIRVTEGVANPDIERVTIEAVLQELIASSSIEKYYVGRIASISSRLGIHRTEFKKYAEGKENYLDITEWKTFNTTKREALLASLSAINL